MAPKFRLYSSCLHTVHTIHTVITILCLTESYVSGLQCDPSSDPSCVLDTTPSVFGLRVDSLSQNETTIPGPHNKGSFVDNCIYKCKGTDKCVSPDQLCDLSSDCDQSDDEQQLCDQLPNGTYCSFGQYNNCFWLNTTDGKEQEDGKKKSFWATEQDETQGFWFMSTIFTNEFKFAKQVNIISTKFGPLPIYHMSPHSKYYESCHVRFSYVLNFPSSELLLETKEDHQNYGNSGKRIELFRQFMGSTGHKLGEPKWTRVSIKLPHLRHTFQLVFSSTTAFRGKTKTTGNTQIIGFDNLTLSRECFGIGVPESEPRTIPTQPPMSRNSIPMTIPRNASLKSFRLSSCGASGRVGPNYKQCESFYANSPTRAAVIDSSSQLVNGSQMWTVPQSGYYTIFARGAQGGHGLHKNSYGGYGALVRAVFKFQEGDTIFTVIGQPGTDACNNDLNLNLKTKCISSHSREAKKRSISRLKDLANNNKNTGGAGGGGGATYVYKIESQQLIPLIIAGGGGGGGSNDAVSGSDPNDIQGQNGRGFEHLTKGSTGNGNYSGGGWFLDPLNKRPTSGSALLEGAKGGYVCDLAKNWHTYGGFGGGGGGCISGGGGGGYQGGDSYTRGRGGQGGSSYVNEQLARLPLRLIEDEDTLNANESVAEVIIFPQIPKCCNNQLFGCVVTGERLDGEIIHHCICSHNDLEEYECLNPSPPLTLLIILSAIFLFIILIVIFGVFAVFKYKKTFNPDNRPVHWNGRDASASQLLSNSSTDVQLSRLRSGHNIITEYNPNYEFGGSTCTLQDLREVPREKLTLIKALGQGAFGEVYQGFLHNMPGEITDELPVAVKTLPEYSANNQAEMDFLMEALIMSKFKHRNIVRFIGVCFEKMPRFIVLELLPGGDLKTFLRESRGTANKPSLLNMGDLLVMALDVALGCQYLEENHFIHRDIAARNCLLSSKIKSQSANINSINSLFNLINYNNGFNNSGIVVKIADFGMARDIYRADYYRKGGKAMLPVKWMPPEAFLDGIFTSKTDVWSFGVLLWEVMSMGYMPYPGRGNQEVMQLVTAGGRLDLPNPSTPPQVYAIMTQCWNPLPEHRPTFATIIERLGYCLQDPDVLNVKLPIFQRAPSMERDMTLMRPPPDATDYLVPNNPCSNSNSNYSMSTEKTELLSPDTCSTFSCSNEENNKLLELLDDVHPPVIPPRTVANNWKETSFTERNNSQPKNQIITNANKSNGIKTDQTVSNKVSAQPLVLDASSLLQQPPSRYVNVNVNDSMESLGPNNVRPNTAQQINC